MLSSSEAVWVALSEAVKQVMFMIQVLRSKKILVELPVSTIFMANNITTISSTKHMDVRYMYMKEYVGDVIVKYVFAKSSENGSIILTNLSAELHQKNLNKMIGEKPK